MEFLKSIFIDIEMVVVGCTLMQTDSNEDTVGGGLRGKSLSLLEVAKSLDRAFNEPPTMIPILQV